MFDECLYFNLATLNRQITKIWNDEFSLLGMSPSHGYLLVAIEKNPDLSQKDLSELMDLDASTITRFIDVLFRKKLIDKSGVGKGARYSITMEGNTVASRINVMLDKLYADMQSTFGKQNLSHFVTSLRTSKQTLKEKYQ